jgi:hypothetical protein
MARVYMITEAEMNSLMDQLKLQSMSDQNILIHPDRYEKLSAEEMNRLNNVHRAFHMVCVRWAQEMGFKGYRP